MSLRSPRIFGPALFGLVAAAFALVMAAGSLSAAGGSDPYLGGDLPMPPAPERPRTPLSLYDALSVPEVSPRGSPRKSVDPDQWYAKGREFADGIGAAKDPEEAAYRLKRVVLKQLGPREVASLNRIGYFYAIGQGVPQDFGLARQFWEIAAAAGDASSVCSLGVLYESGLGVEIDRDKALAWYKKAADLGYAKATDALARLVKP